MVHHATAATLTAWARPGHLYAAALLLSMVAAHAAQHLDQEQVGSLRPTVAPGAFSLQPQTVPATAATTVTLHGSGFSEGAMVEIEPAGVHRQGLIFTGQPPRDSALHGGLALVAGQDTTRVYDVSNPEMPILRSTLPTGSHVDWLGDLAVVVGTELQVLDLTNPASPVVVSSLPGVTAPGGMMVSGSSVYIGRYDGVMIVDLSDPAAPRVAGSVGFGGGQAIDVEDGRLYVLDSPSVWIWDTSDIDDVRFLGILSSHSSTDLDVEQNRLALVSPQTGLRVLDVADPMAPVLLATNPAYTHTPVLWFGEALLTFDAGFLVALDGDSLEPIVRLRLLFARAERLHRDGGRVITANQFESAAYIIGVGDLLGSPVGATLSFDGIAGPAEVDDGRLYVAIENSGVAIENSGVAIYDLTDPLQPELLGSFLTIPGRLRSFTVIDGFAYVMEDVMRLVDVRDPANPEYLGTCAAPFNPLPNGVAPPFIFGRAAGHLWVCDARDPSNPLVYDTGVDLRSATLFDISGARLYTWARGLGIVDLTDPLHPQELSFSANPNLEPRSLAATGGRVYLASNAQLRVFDVSTTTPVLSGGLSIGLSGLRKAGKTLVGRDSDGTFRILELDDPDRPRRAAAFASLSLAKPEFAASEDVLAAPLFHGIHRSDKLEIWRMNPRVRHLVRESEDRLHFEVPAGWVAGRYHVRVVDPDRSVRTLFDGLEVCAGTTVLARLAPREPLLPLRWGISTLDPLGSPTGAATGLQLPPGAEDAPVFTHPGQSQDVIQVELDAGGRAISVHLSGPDPEALAERWHTYREEGALPWPEVEPGIFGDVVLFARSRRAFLPAFAPRSRSISYVLSDGWLASASTILTSVDFTVQVTGIGTCGGTAEVSFRTALDEFCAASLWEHPEMASVCPQRPIRPRPPVAAPESGRTLSLRPRLD